MMRYSLLCILFACGASACGTTASDPTTDVDPREQDPPTEQDPALGELALLLELPILPNEEPVDGPFIYEWLSNGAQTAAEMELHFALGAEFADFVEVDLTPEYIDCDPSTVNWMPALGSVVTTSVSDDAQSLNPSLDGALLRLAPTEPGVFDLTVEASYLPAEEECIGEGPVPVRASFTLVVGVPSRSEIVHADPAEPGSSFIVATNSSPRAGVSIALYLEDDTPLFPANAARFGAAEIWGPADVELSLAEGTDTLAGVVFPAEATELVLKLGTGEREPLIVVDAPMVTAIDVAWWIDGHSSVAIGEGDLVELPARSAGAVAPGSSAVYVGDDLLVSPVDPAWFRIETETPETCEAGEWVTTWGDRLGPSGTLLQDGTCELTVSADDLFGGQGFSDTRRADYTGVY